MAKKLFMVSLGCSKNQVDSEVMLGRLGSYVISDSPEDADVIIVNTCGFIDAAKQESINTVLSLHAQRKEGSRLVMAGCLSERYKDELRQELSEVDLFTGVGDYAHIDELLESGNSTFSDKTFLIDEQERVVINSSYHAYIKLAEGCNQQCSFCAIPSFKGRLFSRTPESIIREISTLSQKGYFDFSLIAQDSSSYLRDRGTKNGLASLIRRIDEVSGDFYARILYLYPSSVDDELIETIATSGHVVPYFDMPIQHISDSMLSRMRRGHNKKRTLELLTKMRTVANSFVRTSVIVGHPGETQDDFDELCECIETFDFDAVNVFEYSDEEGTPAYAMSDKVDKKTISKRLKKLEKIIADKSAQKAASFIGTKFDAVLEGESDEHEFLLRAKRKIWAPDIDGELLINDSDVENPVFGTLYTVQATEAAGGTIIARIDAPAQ